MFCFISQLRTTKTPKEIVCFTPAGLQIGSGFKEHDLITCESKVQVVVSQGVTEFCSPQGLSDFCPRHVPRFPPIGNVLELEGITRVIIPYSLNMASVPVILGAFYFNSLTFGGVSIISSLAAYNLWTIQLHGWPSSSMC